MLYLTKITFNKLILGNIKVALTDILKLQLNRHGEQNNITE